jgi:hypothetical protein
MEEQNNNVDSKRPGNVTDTGWIGKESPPLPKFTRRQIVAFGVDDKNLLDSPSAVSLFCFRQ